MLDCIDILTALIEKGLRHLAYLLIRFPVDILTALIEKGLRLLLLLWQWRRGLTY